jgi:hypothetical protein
MVEHDLRDARLGGAELRIAVVERTSDERQRSEGWTMEADHSSRHVPRRSDLMILQLD